MPPLGRETVSVRQGQPGWIAVHSEARTLRSMFWFAQVLWFRASKDNPNETTVAFRDLSGVEVVGVPPVELADVLKVARTEFNASTETAKKVRHLLSQHEAAQSKTRKSAA